MRQQWLNWNCKVDVGEVTLIQKREREKTDSSNRHALLSAWVTLDWHNINWKIWTFSISAFHVPELFSHVAVIVANVVHGGGSAVVVVVVLVVTANVSTYCFSSPFSFFRFVFVPVFFVVFRHTKSRLKNNLIVFDWTQETEKRV